MVHEADTGCQDLVAVGALELLARGLVTHGAALRHHHLRGPGLGLQRPGRLGDADPSLAQLKEDLRVVFGLPASLAGTQGVGHEKRVAGLRRHRVRPRVLVSVY